MQPLVVPLCYFPSLVLFVDNGHDFLLNAMLQLSEQTAYRLFDSPIDALDFISTYRHSYKVMWHHCFSEYRDACLVSGAEMDIRLAPIHAEIYNPYRFSELSVLVFDFNIRGMNGIDFSQRVNHTTIKKLLLIDEDKETEALEALEKGIIHAYVCKQDKNFIEIMNQQITKLQLSYFISMSNHIGKILDIHFSDCLYQADFASLLSVVKEKYRIIEHYMMDTRGSFLMLDEDACLGMFSLLTEKEDNPSSFYFHGSSRYAYTSYREQFLLRHQKIFSYHRYLEELDAEELLVS